MEKISNDVRTSYMFSRILNSQFVIFREKIGFSVKNGELYWHFLIHFVSEKKPPFSTYRNKGQISREKYRFRIFRIRENM